jgi:hypothetical protein
MNGPGGFVAGLSKTVAFFDVEVIERAIELQTDERFTAQCNSASCDPPSTTTISPVM